jgi:hypothetical protein
MLYLEPASDQRQNSQNQNHIAEHALSFKGSSEDSRPYPSRSVQHEKDASRKEAEGAYRSHSSSRDVSTFELSVNLGEIESEISVGQD